jgi:hypothetical protein
MARNAHGFAACARLLYSAFIGNEKRFVVARVADAVGIGAATLYGYCENAESMPVDVLRRMAKLVRVRQCDVRLLSELLDLGGAGLVLVELPEGVTAADVQAAGLKLGAAVGKMLGDVASAMDDGTVDAAEARTLERDRDDVLRLAQSVCDSATKRGRR